MKAGIGTMNPMTPVGTHTAAVPAGLHDECARTGHATREQERVDDRLRFAGDGWRAHGPRGGGSRAVAGRLVVAVSPGTGDGRDHEEARHDAATEPGAIVVAGAAVG